MLILWREENRRTRRKTLWAKTKTNNKLNPLMTPGLRFEPGPHWWEASAITTALPLRHPCSPFVCFFLHLNYPCHADFVDSRCQEKIIRPRFETEAKKPTRFVQLWTSHLEQLFSIGLSPALHLSSAAGHENCVHMLLRLHNADASLQDCLGQTALDLALKPAVLRIFESLGPWPHLRITM